MEWTEPKSPTEGESYYDHVKCETPLGGIIIEWKSWKSDPDYGIEIDGKYIDTCYALENAKLRARLYLTNMQEELYQYLNTYTNGRKRE
jgi:hypothetical protein